MSDAIKITELRIGDQVEIPPVFFCRSGETGDVVEIFDDGVALDFFSDCRGFYPRCSGMPGIEFWSFVELADAFISRPE